MTARIQIEVNGRGSYIVHRSGQDYKWNCQESTDV